MSTQIDLTGGLVFLVYAKGKQHGGGVHGVLLEPGRSSIAVPRRLDGGDPEEALLHLHGIDTDDVRTSFARRLREWADRIDVGNEPDVRFPVDVLRDAHIRADAEFLSDLLAKLEKVLPDGTPRTVDAIVSAIQHWRDIAGASLKSHNEMRKEIASLEAALQMCSEARVKLAAQIDPCLSG